jgi:hypothetical protein
MAKKGHKVCNGRQSMTIKSDVSNTLLLKQEAPMLRTNGSVAARERYGDQAGGCVIIPARQATDRIPFALAQFKIRYRFAGQVVPGVGADPTPNLSGMSTQDIRGIL